MNHNRFWSLSALPFGLSNELESFLRDAYESPVRPYHNFGHIEEVLAQYAAIEWEDPYTVAWAILFHDSIYEFGAKNNEARSANLAEGAFEIYCKDLPIDILRAKELIRITASHGILESGKLDHDTAHFVDCDMSVLGSPPARYDMYERDIALEYAHIPPDAYRTGRTKFLRTVLKSDVIFMTGHFRRLYENQARENIARAIKTLES